MIRRNSVIVIAVVSLLPALAADAWAESRPAGYAGRSVAAVLDEFRSRGYPFAYSTNLIDAALTVTTEPEAEEPLEIAEQILAPHGLAILEEHGFYLVVRRESPDQRAGSMLLIVRERPGWRPLAGPSIISRPALDRGEILISGVQQYSDLAPQQYHVRIEADGFEPRSSVIDVRPGETAVLEVALEPRRPEIENITVSSSRYDVWSDTTSSPFFIDQRSIQNLPNLADDPLRAVQRLPGSAGGGVSARTHFRGGEQRESSIYLNGYELFDPFHARDFQNFFSVVDPRAVDGVAVYTGGFPVAYGDQMSAVVVMESLDRSANPRIERREGGEAQRVARVSRRFSIGDSTLATFFELSNAFDRRNPCCVDYDLEQDGAGNAVLVRQEENWPPLLPAIGFLWEF